MKRNDKEGRTSNAYAARGRRRGGIAAQNKKRRKGRLAAHRGPNLWRLLLFLIGAIAMRGAGCTYNDILDRKLDAQVERTRNRPLPSRRVTVRAAVAFVAQALVGRKGAAGMALYEDLRERIVGRWWKGDVAQRGGQTFWGQASPAPCARLRALERAYLHLGRRLFFEAGYVEAD